MSNFKSPNQRTQNIRSMHNTHQNMSSWNSEVNVDKWIQDDASSHYSEDLGSDGNRAPDIGQRLHGLFKNQLYTDVKFVLSCGIKPKPFLEAHRAILAAGSSKFADMLYGEGSQEIVEDIHPEIQINNVPFEAFKNVVEFLYTDDIFFSSDPSVMETLTAAKTFQVHALVERCESYFESAEITDHNACTKLHLSIQHKLDSLKNRCTQYIQENTQGVIESHDFKSIPLATIRTICKFPKFNLRSEKQLFDAVMKWIETQPQGQSRKKELLEPFLKNIRFLTIPLTEFTAIVTQCQDQGIFSSEDALSIVMYLSNPTKNPPTNLPSWCNKGANRCVFVNFPTRPVNKSRVAVQTVNLSLKQLKRGYINSLICVLEMKCLKGNWQVKGLKLAFGDPVLEHSRIGHLSIAVDVKPSGFNFMEHCKIENSKELIITFSRNTLVRNGDIFHVRAEANEAKGYNFLQFGEQNSFSESCPFECSLGSVPKENRLFFIKEVMYVPTQPRAKNVKNFRAGRRLPQMPQNIL